MKAPAMVMVLVAILIGCSPPVSRYQALLDGLPIPAGWERRTERIQAPGTSTTCATILPHCPMVTRYYVVPGTPADAYAQAKQLVVGAGFALKNDFSDCRPPPASPACGMSATFDGDEVQVSAYNPGDDPDLVYAPVDRAVVRISAGTK